jgi:outer membrane lipoprotein SlyB
MKRFGFVALTLVALGGCAQAYNPVIDTQGHDSARYQQDLAECRQYAAQVEPVGTAAVGAVTGAAAGAALGAITGALVGGVGAGEAAAFGAATGGAVGLGAGIYEGTTGQRQALTNCMSGRGYNVLY